MNRYSHRVVLILCLSCLTYSQLRAGTVFNDFGPGHTLVVNDVYQGEAVSGDCDAERGACQQPFPCRLAASKRVHLRCIEAGSLCLLKSPGCASLCVHS
jgi:hypothetical protein